MSSNIKICVIIIIRVYIAVG